MNETQKGWRGRTVKLGDLVRIRRELGRGTFIGRVTAIHGNAHFPRCEVEIVRAPQNSAWKPKARVDIDSWWLDPGLPRENRRG